jgi:type I restriction enzyme S subunit
MAQGDAVVHLYSRHLAELELFLPSEEEQRAIADALSDVDALIERLDALTAKKRAIKTATMQRLLTGKQRLSGFDGDWTTKRLGEIGSFTKGKGIPKKDTVESGIPCVRYAELYTHHEDIIHDFVSFIPKSVSEGARQIKKGDVLFAGSGETKEEIGMCAAYLGDEEAYAGGDIVILSPDSEDSRFLGYALNSPKAVEQKSSMAQGDAVVHIYSRHLERLELDLPPLNEQKAIATILSDMDAEIDALQARRDKTQDIKQGMMQELLTGRTRLV